MPDEERLKQRMQRIAELVARFDAAADPGVKAQARELLEAVMDFHGEALSRILERLDPTTLDALAADPVVSSVLLLHGLHPHDFETRVRSAFERAQPTLRAYGAIAELAGVTAGAVRIRLRGVDSAFTARTVRAAIEEELYAAAPDAVSLVVQGLEQFAPPDFVPLQSLVNNPVAAAREGD